MPEPFWETEQDLSDAAQERIKPDEEFEADNPDRAAASINSARELEFSEPIEDVLRDKAEAIQMIDNDPSKPDRFEDDVFRSEQRAFQAVKAVFSRGLGAAQSSRGVQSAPQWGFARVDEFGGIVKTGEPDDAEYQSDDDLLPDGHPDATRADEKPFVEGVPSGKTRETIESEVFD